MWRDDRIQAVIDTTTGFIAATLAERLKRPLHEMERLFLASKTYGLLCDSETGLYADNVLETADLFLREVASALFAEKDLTAQSYFKYRSLSDSYTKNIFEKKELWYAVPASFNDPFDCNLQLNCNGSSDQEIKDAIFDMYRKRGTPVSDVSDAGWQKSISGVRKGNGCSTDMFAEERESYYKRSSVLSLSLTGNSIPLFAYYANDHKGVCIEFSFSEFDLPCGYSFAQRLLGCRRISGNKVIYRDAIPELNYLTLRTKTSDDDSNLIQSLILTKAKCWEHEREYRIFRDQIPAGPANFAPKILKRVILGAKTTDKEKELVKTWLKDWPTPVILSQAETDFQSFKLNIRDVETIEAK